MREAVEADIGWPDKWCDHFMYPEFVCGRRFCHVIKQRMCGICGERWRIKRCPHGDADCQRSLDDPP